MLAEPQPVCTSSSHGLLMPSKSRLWSWSASATPVFIVRFSGNHRCPGKYVAPGHQCVLHFSGDAGTIGGQLTRTSRRCCARGPGLRRSAGSEILIAPATTHGDVVQGRRQFREGVRLVRDVGERFLASECCIAGSPVIHPGRVWVGRQRTAAGDLPGRRSVSTTSLVAADREARAGFQACCSAACGMRSTSPAARRSRISAATVCSRVSCLSCPSARAGKRRGVATDARCPAGKHGRRNGW